jgi:hypothetical protein
MLLLLMWLIYEVHRWDDATVEVLDVCLRTSYFQVGDTFFQQKDGMDTGSFLSLIIGTILLNILRNFLLAQHNIKQRCGSGTLMTRLWSDLMVQSGYSISSATSLVPRLPSRSLQEHSQTTRLTFLMFWSSGKRRHWSQESTGKSPTLADISTSNLTIRRMWKEVCFRVFTTKLPSYAKKNKFWLKKSAGWDAITSSSVIPKI